MGVSALDTSPGLGCVQTHHKTCGALLGARSGAPSAIGEWRRAGFEPERRRRQVNHPTAYRCAGLFAVSVTLVVSALWRFAEERPGTRRGCRPRCAMVTTRAAARGEQSDGVAARGCVGQAERDGTGALLFAASVV